ncbi:MAG: sodium-dependent transporter [Lysobacterales bacterium]
MSRPTFSSQWATVLTMTGMAVGLGNVWRFPYMMGQHGGGAFLLMYLILMLIFAVPALCAEWGLGRITGKGPIGALSQAFGKTPGTIIGTLLLCSLLVTVSYYALVIGNVAYSTWFAFVQGFSEQSLASYREGLASHTTQWGFGLLVIVVSLLIVSRGLRRGVEAANMLLVPAFALAALYTIFAVFRLDGAVPRMMEFLSFDFARLNAEVAFAALGQTCFSVGLSGTIGVVLGSYMRQSQSLLGTAITTSTLDVMAALMASLFIVPVVLLYGIDMAAGPGLLFDTMPTLFSLIPGGRVLAGVFLTSWVSVALLTLIATLNALQTGFSELGPLKPHRRWLGLGCAGVMALIVTPIAFNPHWIGTLDTIFGSGMFMLGALIVVAAMGWGMGQAATQSQVDPDSRRPFVVFWIRWVIPPTVAVVLLGFLYTTLSAGGHA